MIRMNDDRVTRPRVLPRKRRIDCVDDDLQNLDIRNRKVVAESAKTSLG